MRFVRLIPVVVLLCSLFVPVAQAGTEVGIITGFNFSNLRIDQHSGLEGRSSFAIGGVVDYAIRDRFGIRVEPTFLSKGAKATNRNAYWGSIDGVTFDLDYIDLPILARFDLESAPTHAYLLGGFSYSIATHREADLTKAYDAENLDMSGVFKSNDVSLDLGLGMSFKAGSGRMGIDGRSAIGLVNINNGGTITFAGAPLAVPSTATHTLDFRLFVSYLFPLGGE